MFLRKENIEKLQNDTFDALVIGGGINGASAAAALAGKGAKVALIERGDFACETSQSSSNLIWGGIKYLEGFEFSLVRKLCLSRNKLRRSFPSTVKEIRFFTTHNPNAHHPRFLLYLGTWIYWLIGNGFTKKPSIFTRKYMQKKEPIINVSNCKGGVEYSDAYLKDNDARFVFQFIYSAMCQGTVVANYTTAKNSQLNDDNIWETTAKNSYGDFTIRSKIIVNACGPFVDEYNNTCNETTKSCHIFSKGVHLTVNKLTSTQKVLTFFANDGRMFFVVPMGDKSCIGTTDTRVESPQPNVTEEDRNFILDNINALLDLEKPLQKKDIIAERCGVRPLVVKREDAAQKADWVKLSRKHVIEVKDQHISIFGGKLTDCLNIGEEVITKAQFLGIEFPYIDRKWYGESPQQTKNSFLYQAQTLGISVEAAERWWRYYDVDSFELITNVRCDATMKEILIPQISYYKCEAIFCAKREMVVTLEDFLRRRTQLAMIMTKQQLQENQGLKKVNEILFGAQADNQWNTYFK